MQFRILGHACLEVSGSATLLCDPWLTGSCYWRSWWNYPPVPPNLASELNPDFIYITHLHWDHFHSPTLERLGKNKRILIPKTPERRIRDDLAQLGFRDVVELPHATRIELGPNLAVTSYQFYWFTDSALVIECDGVTIFNVNDAKFFGAPLRQILKRHPRIDFVLRSHSSANARVCYEIIDEDDRHLDDLGKYSKEFAEFVRAVAPKYAIPFASNHCYLHEDTFHFNKITNYSPNVVEYFKHHGISEPTCVSMAPGDQWSQANGFELSPINWYDNLEQRFDDYRGGKLRTLNSARNREHRTKPSKRAARIYESQLATIPFLLRLLFRKHPITLVLHSGNQEVGLAIDLYRAKCQWLSEWQAMPILVHLPTLIFQECVLRKNWNSLTISKRLRVRVTRRDAKYFNLFIVINKCFDHGILPMRKCANWRFISIWLIRWREIALYTQIIMKQYILRRRFNYADYL